MDKFARRGADGILHNFEYLDNVTDEMCVPLRTENGLTAWKYTFNDKIVWIPSGSIRGIVDYGCIYRLLSGIPIDYAAEYEVYDDKTGITAVALGMADGILFSEENECIEQNLDTIKFGTPEVKNEKSKTIGIFFKGALSNIIDDRNYDKVYNLFRGTFMGVLNYMFFSALSYSKRETNYAVEHVTLCGDYALLRYKRVEGHADHGPVEGEEPVETTEEKK